MTDNTDHSQIIISILHLKELTSAPSAAQIEGATGSGEQLQVCFLMLKLCRVISYSINNVRLFFAFVSVLDIL